MAPGLVNLLLTVSEPLQLAPFLSLTPQGGVPVSIGLTRRSDTEYAGSLVIAETTPTGTANAVFSGRDLVGNRGTKIDSGSAIALDTEGPAVTQITLQPGQPIKNDSHNPVSVTVTIGLNEAMKPGEAPELSYLLSGEGRTPIPIASLVQVGAQPGQAQAWQATFPLPADAGLAKAETFRFLYRGVDSLGNVSTRILGDNLFQVYQGDLPPLETPTGLKGQSLPGGKVRLSWNPVEGAVGYHLYRQAPGENGLTPYQRLGTVLEFLDAPPSDGLYRYAVASIRQENGQESISGMGPLVEVVSDSVSPDSPGRPVLELVGARIQAQWEAPPDSGPITYSLYRANLAEITSVAGLTPIATGIPQTTAIDPRPSPLDHAYVVTAVDPAGNESLPSNSFYLNFALLPVSSLSVLQTGNDPPVLSLTHPGGGVAGYNLYLGLEGRRVKLNQDLWPDLSYTDVGYAGEERRYTVMAVDDNHQESVGRSLTLPALRATLQEGAQVRRGLMNRLEYRVESSSSTRVDHIRLKVKLDTHLHTSEELSLEAGASQVVPVTVGGHADLPDLAPLTTTIEVTPQEGEKVEIVRHAEIEVGDGMLVLGILNEELLRGGTGKVRFTLENTGQEEIEIVTATGAGASASNEVTFYLLDPDGNVLSSRAYKQNLGEGVVTLANGNTVARIPAGSVFTSEPLELPVPLSSPDKVTLQLEVARVHFHQGRADQVSIEGPSTTHPVSLIDTAYYGAMQTIAPESSSGDRGITITGRAVERNTGRTLPKVPLNLVISVNGFDRTYPLFTDEGGAFSFTFTPLPGESGLYKVRAIHPQLLDRPVQGQFVINRIGINPATINLNLPRNYERKVNVQVAAGEGTAVSNLRLAYEALDQPEGAFPQGIHVALGSPVTSLGSGQTASLDFSLWADNTAQEAGRIVLQVKSDGTGGDSWGSVLLNAQFSEARLALYFSPDHVETGVARGQSVTETVVLENKGVADLNDLSLAVVSQDGRPAPGWVHLNSAADQSTLPVGAKREIGLTFSPPSGVAEGIYTLYLRVTGSNSPTTDIGIYVSVTQSGIGSVLFKVSDIYTATVDRNGQLIQGLAGAKIRVQNEEVLTVERTQTTDGLGEALLADLPAGRYKYRISADNHQEHIGRLWIKPGITVSQEVFLDYNLVTVEWEVAETTIRDKYEIVLSATYETDVPAAVVVAAPASITLPKMKAGDVYYGEFTLTNYGLIRADNLQFALPQDDQNFKYELLKGLPKSLGAKERITVPYRVTALRSLDQEEEGSGSGGGCQR